MTLICVQPSLLYYAWQVEVMLNNFISLDIHKHYDIHCLFAFNQNESDWQEKVSTIEKLENKFGDDVQFFYYEDTRTTPIKYIPSIRPNILKKHFKRFTYLSKQAIFYHDCDMVFTRFPSFLQNMIEGDCWYLSNTISYIGYEYIKTKGEEILDTMCEIVGIDKEVVRKNQNNSGGAQYVLKNVDYEFFEKMERDCEEMYERVGRISYLKKKSNPNYHELQIWCADMWCMLWSAWLRGYETKIAKEMDFCWATDYIGKWDENYIYHNAGATIHDKGRLFYKGEYIKKLPYFDNFDSITNEKCTYRYVDCINKAKANSCLI